MGQGRNRYVLPCLKTVVVHQYTSSAVSGSEPSGQPGL